MVEPEAAGDWAIPEISSPPRPPTPSPPPATTAGRPVRANRNVLPSRYRDLPPQGPEPLLLAREPEVDPSPLHPAGRDMSPIANVELGNITRTAANAFGLIREYTGPLPLRDPEDETSLTELLAIEAPARLAANAIQPYYHPYPNVSAFHLDRWYWDGAIKSNQDFDKLRSIILEPTFNPEDIRDVNFPKIRTEIGSSSSDLFDRRDGWTCSSVTVKVPFGNMTLPPQDFTIEGVWHKSLTGIIQSTFSSPRSRSYHYVPYRLIHDRPGFPERTVHGELYTSSAFRRAHNELLLSPSEPGCTLPRAIAAHMLWSDSTHLTDFGTASLWPVYNQFGNLSKYRRGQPSVKAFDHVAYIPSVSLTMAYRLRLADLTVFTAASYYCTILPQHYG